VKQRKTKAQKRKLAHERRSLDRAILRLTRTFWNGQGSLSDSEQREQRELLGLVQARRRVA